MSTSKTIARPYAKAVFEHANSHNELENWSKRLEILAAIVLDSNATQFIHNPATTAAEQAALLLNTCNEYVAKDDKQYLEQFIQLLAVNKRLLVLPEIFSLFEIMRAEKEKTLVVDVISYAKLSKDQQKKLIDSLNKRLQLQVVLNIIIDKSLLGGAVINAGGLVIDGSVRGKLNKLSASLAA